MHNMQNEFHEQPMPYLGRDPTPDEKVEWARREKERLYVFEGGRLMGREASATTAHMTHLHSGGCWCCAFPMSQYNAARSLEPSSEKGYRCLNCGVRMHHTVPFVAFGPPWHWSRPEDMTIQEMLEWIEAHRSIWSKAS